MDRNLGAWLPRVSWKKTSTLLHVTKLSMSPIPDLFLALQGAKTHTAYFVCGNPAWIEGEQQVSEIEKVIKKQPPEEPGRKKSGGGE
jgi:hypothetical protein